MKSDKINNKQEEGFAGTLRNIQLNDLIQMCCLSAVSLGIRVTKNKKNGTIFIQDGQIVHAEVESIQGEEAFYTILGWESGVFETIDSGVITNPTIQKNYQFLLMEAAHQADERESKSDESERKSSSNIQKLKVLVVDDSTMMSKILSSMINADDRMEVVGVAENGEKALTMLDELNPDIVTLDVNMPIMDGSTALKHIMIKSPCPVLIMSNVGDGSHKGIIDFLNLGAVDFMSKPVQNKYILIQQQKIVERILQVAGAQTNCFKRIRTSKVLQKRNFPINDKRHIDYLIVISAGAGGHTVLLNLVSRLPVILNHSVLILQTIPPALAKTVAGYLNERSQLKVMHLSDDLPLRGGECIFTTHGRKIMVESEENTTLIGIENYQEIEFQNPYYDELLFSLADKFTDRIRLVLLSGAEIGSFDGLRKIRQNGGKIIIQNRSACVVPSPLQMVAEQDLFDLELNIEDIIKELTLA